MKLKTHNTPLPNDIYVKGVGVYRVLVYNETDDTVLFATTNDIITFPGKIKRRDVGKSGLHLCPLELRSAAVQVFELDSMLNNQSLDKLKVYRYRHAKVYERLKLAKLLGEAATRTYIVPDEQGEQFPQLKGKSFEIPVPFYCLTKEAYRKAYQSIKYDTMSEFAWAMTKCKWPVFYVPKIFGEPCLSNQQKEISSIE